jgi:hypothetical protein
MLLLEETDLGLAHRPAVDLQASEVCNQRLSTAGLTVMLLGVAQGDIIANAIARYALTEITREVH